MMGYLLVGTMLAVGQVDQGSPSTLPKSASPPAQATPQAADSSAGEKEPKSGENGFAEFIKPTRPPCEIWESH
jgi:hypothetical protein